MKKIIVISVLALSIMTSGFAVYRGLTSSKKTAFVNTVRLYENFQATKERQQRLEDIQNRGSYLLDSLSTAMKDHPGFAKKVSRTTGAAETGELYRQKQMELQSIYGTYSRQFDEEIWQQLNQFVIDYGKEHQYDYIFGASGNGSLMYAGPSQDLTDKLIEYANTRYNGENQ